MDKDVTIDELLAKADLAMSKVKKPRRKGPPRKRKSKAKSGNGYRYIYVNGKPVLEHRVVMERHLKRKLQPHEAVFFRDGDRDNTKIENLILGLKQGIPLDSITCPHCEKPVFNA